MHSFFFSHLKTPSGFPSEAISDLQVAHWTFHSMLLGTSLRQDNLADLNFHSFFYIIYVRYLYCSLILFILFQWEGSYPSFYLGQTGSRLSEWVTTCALSIVWILPVCLLFPHFPQSQQKVSWPAERQWTLFMERAAVTHRDNVKII